MLKFSSWIFKLQNLFVRYIGAFVGARKICKNFYLFIVILFCSINPKKTNRIRPQASWFARLAVLEARASKRANLIWLLYLPVIFFVYGFVLGRIFFSFSLFPVPPSLPLSLSLLPPLSHSLFFLWSIRYYLFATRSCFICVVRILCLLSCKCLVHVSSPSELLHQSIRGTYKSLAAIK